MEVMMSTSEEVVGFSKEEVNDLDVTLQKERIEIVEVVSSIVGYFEVHEEDSHVHS